GPARAASDGRPYVIAADGGPAFQDDGASAPAAPAAPAPAPPAAPPTCAGCVATVVGIDEAFAVACGPTTIYVGTKKGALFEVERDASNAKALLPSAGSPIGFLEVADGRLFYSLPSLGQLRRRDLGTGLDISLAA